MSDYLVGRVKASKPVTLHPRTVIVGLDREHRSKRLTWKKRDTSQKETRPIANLS